MYMAWAWPKYLLNDVENRRYSDAGWQLFSAGDLPGVAWDSLERFVESANKRWRRELGEWREDQDYQLCPVSFRRVLSDTVICVQGGRPPGSFIHIEPVLAKGPWSVAKAIYTVRWCSVCRGWQHHDVSVPRPMWQCRRCQFITSYHA